MRPTGHTFTEVMEARLSRRDLIKGALASATVLYLPIVRTKRYVPVPPPSRGLGFTPIPPHTADRLAIAPGYRAEVLLGWGDPILPGAPPFDPERPTPEAQVLQFGYNCDYVGFMPLPRGSGTPDHGLLVVNHEFTNPELMFREFDLDNISERKVAVQLAAVGLSIVEVFSDQDGRWLVRRDSPYNRRITGFTPMELTGPAAGHAWLRTKADPSGRRVLGTLANCSAGKTPWGTILSAEENFQDCFGERDLLKADEARMWNHIRFNVMRERTKVGFDQVYDRFDLSKEPNEAFRFGWVVEVDPYDPTWVPRKRTALGRFRHEGATSTVTPSGQVVFYSSDDTVFEYVYKFVTAGAYRPNDRAANRDLLDHGTLYAARFNADGTGRWLPLVHGYGPLVAANDFRSQGDVLVNTVFAADRLGATRMDRPEDIEVNPTTGKVYIALTRNVDRGGEGDRKWPPDPANPRAANTWGHVIELIESGGTHASTTFTWSIFLLCGDPADSTTYYAGYPKDRVSAIAGPDNLTFDLHGNLWIATDGQQQYLGMNEGLYAVPTEGPERGHVQRFFAGVPGAEITGPEFNPNGDTLFLAVQHPGEGGRWAEPTSHWPDGKQPARPSVVVIQAEDGRRVGT
jgi:secreted PhoX family phosphatase